MLQWCKLYGYFDDFMKLECYFMSLNHELRDEDFYVSSYVIDALKLKMHRFGPVHNNL